MKPGEWPENVNNEKKVSSSQGQSCLFSFQRTYILPDLELAKAVFLKRLFLSPFPGTFWEALPGPLRALGG